MKKAIGDNMIRKEWGLEKGLDLVKQAGFDGIELWLGDMPWFQLTTADVEVRELRRKIENAGLVVSNVSTGLHWASPLSARDPNVRGRAVRIVEREIETAVLLGTDAILDRKSTRLNSSHSQISYAVFCLKKKNKSTSYPPTCTRTSSQLRCA